jgi:hypothetical protein
MAQRNELTNFRRGIQVGWKQISFRGSLNGVGTSTDVWLSSIVSEECEGSEHDTEDSAISHALAWLPSGEISATYANGLHKPMLMTREDSFHRVASAGSSLGDENSSVCRSYSAGSSCCDRSSPQYECDNDRMGQRGYNNETDENSHTEDMDAGSENSERDNLDGRGLGTRYFWPHQCRQTAATAVLVPWSACVHSISPISTATVIVAMFGYFLFFIYFSTCVA